MRVLATEGRQRLVIAVAGATRFMAGILMGTGMAVYVGDAGGSAFAVSMVLTAYYVGMTVFAPVWGAIADVTGRRRAVMVATGTLATLSVLPLVAVGEVGPAISLGGLTVGGVWVPIAFRGLYAVFAVGFIPVMLSVVSARGGADGRGRSLGFFNSARAVGFSGGQIAVGTLLGLLAPASLYLLIAAVSLVSTATAVLVLDPTASPAEQPTASDVAGEVRTRLLPAVGDRGHLRTNGLRWLYVALALRNMTVLGVMSLMPVYLTGPVGVTTAVMGVLLAINPTAQVAFMYLFGRVADRAGRTLPIVVGIAGSGVFAVVVALVPLPGSTPVRLLVAGAAFVTIAAAFSAMTTGALAFIGDVAPPERESELMGLRSTAKGVGGILGPPLIGTLATATSMQVAFAAGSVLALGAALLAAVGLTEPDRRASDAVVPAADAEPATD
ncbi:MAG: MFS transporter [Haloarculaceae archaeon]